MAHRISQIKIDNYKSIVSETFDLSDYTPLIGYNNAGKSNILYAIKWLLRRSSLGADAFNQINTAVTMVGVIDGIDNALLNLLPQNHRNSIQPYIVNDQLKIKRVQNQPNDTAANIRLFVHDPNAANAAQPWVANPNGIDNALTVLFPEPIHIGAMENAEEDVSKSKAGTTIGKLLAEIIEPIENQYGAQVRGILDGLKGLLDADGLNRAPELAQFDAAVNQKIDTFFPDVNIKLHVPTPELKEVFNKGTIKIYEPQSPLGRDISSLGHGAQRSIQMALVRHLAELKRAAQNHGTTTLLLIDEPELYLHPQAIEIIRDALKSLSTQGYQVIFSTHSAMMVTHDDVANAILIRKRHPQGTYRRQTLKAAIPQVAADAPSQLQLLFSLSNSTNILFSEKVVLTEGKTEQRVLPKIFEKVTGKTLGIYKYALVRQGGVASTRKSMMVLNAMDLPTKAIVDLDYAFRNAVADGFLQPADPDLGACHQHMGHIAVVNGIALEADGYPTNRNSSMSTSDAIAFLAAQQPIHQNIINLHTKLLAHNIWLWKKGAIEAHIGLTGKTEQIWANFVNQLQANPLNVAAIDHAEITACINWLTN
ncbi:MAG: AAA family ATPase [Bacteroidia bacterium]|nr:AAA family ATPase [Bacteroidia bacterium]MCF8446855.1 AAA family ATPase [Bacteroidia bacterium]